MDPLTGEIREVAPDHPKAVPLLDRHLRLMRASSPACSVHALDGPALSDAGARFFVLIRDDVAVAMGALKVIDDAHGELKSMHVVEDLRGRGFAGRILKHLMAKAREAGLTRVSLETGAQPAFAPARAFYRAHGFVECPPFAAYAPDPHSIFMTRTLGGAGCA